MLFIFLTLLAFALFAVLVTVSTAGISPASASSLLAAPRQLRVLFRNRSVRKNHALEHATINVIEERLGLSRLAGIALEHGFIIRGGASPDLVASAAREAVQRLRAGERRLAIHPRCATTIVAAQLVVGAIFLALWIVTRQVGWVSLALAILSAGILAPRLSPFLQRFVTTDPDIGALQVASVQLQSPSGRLGLVSMFVLGPVLVRTSESDTQNHEKSADNGRVTVITGDHEEVIAGGYRIR